MLAAKTGDTVKVHYTGILDDGTWFDSSHGRNPLQFILGGGGIFPALETAVEGMSVGSTKTIIIPAADAFGPRLDGLTREVPREDIPDDIELAEGMMLNAQGAGGQTQRFTVVDFDDQNVKIDSNHPLAGKDLIFKLELMELA
jgi:peptidylprolyl isomerase